tara:strand:- start:323 stop:775 length:453 start_codon:yes stop_codon:yes gene_type:complete
MKNRRYFLKNACKPIVIAALGIPVIEACSSEDDSSVSTQTTSSSNNFSPQGVTSTELIIDLDDNTFSSLQEIGGWLNFTSENILLVRISDSEIRVFNNACPHQGSRNQWSFDGTNFTCARHGNSFGATCSGSMRCFDSSLDGNILTVDLG